MTTPSYADLRVELTALAETQTFSPDPSAWDRGRRARRRTRAARGAAALAVVALVAGAGVLVGRPDAVAPATEVRGGAIPSRIPEPDGRSLTDLAIGSASVAYVDTNGMPVLIDATTGEANWVELPDFPTPEVYDLTADFRRGPWLALSPDGTQLAYPTTSREERDPGEFTFITSWYRVVDLESGTSELVEPPPSAFTPLAMSWTPDGRIAVDVPGKPTLEERNPPDVSWTIDPATGDSSRSDLTGVVAPSGLVTASRTEIAKTVGAVPFRNADGVNLVRELPTDLYPDGAVIQPVGWVEADILVASIDPPPSRSVERPRLAVLTSPDQPESAWVFREFLPRLPPNLGLSIAVDLVPDLTGDPDQQLTRDFTAAPPTGDRSGAVGYLVSAGFIVLLGAVALLRWLPKRA